MPGRVRVVATSCPAKTLRRMALSHDCRSCACKTQPRAHVLVREHQRRNTMKEEAYLFERVASPPRLAGQCGQLGLLAGETRRQLRAAATRPCILARHHHRVGCVVVVVVVGVAQGRLQATDAVLQLVDRRLALLLGAAQGSDLLLQGAVGVRRLPHGGPKSRCRGATGDRVCKRGARDALELGGRKYLFERGVHSQEALHALVRPPLHVPVHRRQRRVLLPQPLQRRPQGTGLLRLRCGCGCSGWCDLRCFRGGGRGETTLQVRTQRLRRLEQHHTAKSQRSLCASRTTKAAV